MDDKRRKEHQKEDSEKLKATLDALEKFENQECSFDVALTSLRDFMKNDFPGYIFLLDKPEVKTAIPKIHKELRIIEALLETNQVDPSIVIAKSSALCGVYVTREGKQWTKSKQSLVCLKKGVLLKSPVIKETNERTEFEDKSDSAYGQTDFVYTRPASNANKCNKHSNSEYQNPTNFSIISSSFVPVALWEPSLKDLSLNEIVIEKLKHIENCFRSNEKIDQAKALALDFIKEFGSHLYLGNIHFGGFFQIETKFKITPTHEKAMVKDFVRLSHMFTLFTNELFSNESRKRSLEATNTDSTLFKEGKLVAEETNGITTTLSMVGGPENVSSLLFWNKGLKYSNRTWVVVEAGKSNKIKDKLVLEGFIGIWDLVKNEKTETALEAAKLLKQTWEESSGFKPDDILCETYETLSYKSEFKSHIERISQRLSRTVEAKACVESLQTLHDKVVESLADELYKNLWKQEITFNVSITEMLTRVATIDFTGDELSTIKALIEKLLNLAGDVDFVNKHRIEVWLKYSIPVNHDNCLLKTKQRSLTDLQSSLKDYLENIHSKVNSTGNVTSFPNITPEVTIVVCELLNEFKAKGDLISYLLLLSIVIQLDYDVKKDTFHRQVTVERLETFIKKLDDTKTELRQYVSRPAIVKQALAYFHLKESIINSGMYPKLIAHRKLFEMLKHIKSKGFNLNAAMVSAVDETTVSLEKRLRSLESRDGNYWDKAIISWDYFEKLFDVDFCSINDRKETDFPINIDNSTELMTILEQFSLSEFFPGKLCLQSVLSIDEIKFSSACTMSDIPWVILRKIIAVNFNFRENVLNDFIKQTSQTLDDEDDDLLSEQFGDKSKDLFDFHPLDVFMAIFQCCDPFLKQILAQKISLCQLALPYVFEDHSSGKCILSLWPLRNIHLDSKSGSVATEELKAVSFLRIGTGLSKSKSRIINEFLRDINEEHSTFFHKDCPLGMNKRKITNGMIEATWYVPDKTKCSGDSEGTTKLQSEEPLTVLNLRGDAHSFHGLLKTLLKLSNVVVVLVSAGDIQNEEFSETLKTIHSGNCKTIILTDLTLTERECEFLKTYKNVMTIESSKTKIVTTFLKKQNRHMNQDELQNLVRRNILSMLKDIDKGLKIEEMVDKLDINSDEDGKNYRIKAKATGIYNKIRACSDECNRKKTLLPLQGEKLWQEWSKKQKEQKRQRCQASQYDPEETLLKEMQELRRQQVKACNEPPNIIAEFIHVLVENMHDNECINLFLFWMRQFLDNESRIVIPNLQDELFEALEMYESTERKSEENKQKIDDIEIKLASASFGLEHFFREMGQIYEAFVYSKTDLNCLIATETQQIISLLPMIAAKLLLMGHPLELMDGDAANVPMKWVKAVFREIKVILGDIKLLSISVLGIQSSGKSTLLNTMFGLRFAVSAGRCTRGIFAQLLKVDKSKSNLEFDYVLILDSEGLRAPELAGEKITHDNELATLVIGAADIVLVNIKGETIADMQDVLQIVIHGLMRIKQVNKNLHLRQSSMLVHQNVSAENAQKQMVQGNKKIVENLDKMTKEVANQEQYENISGFKDVIKFDPTKDVRFVPDLWHGARKMSPASPEYSFTVNSIARDLLDFSSSKKRSFMSIENTVLYFDSLWNGILAEDFVFSFRNCLEVKAYSILEFEYQKLNFSFSKLKHYWICEKVKPQLSICKDINELQSVSETLFDNFQKELEIKENEAETKLNSFIDQSDLIDHMIHWKEHKLSCLQIKAESLKDEMKAQIKTEKEKISIAISHEKLLVTKEEQINRKAKDVALSLIGKDLTEKKMGEKFEELWKQWLYELVPKGSVDKSGKRIQLMKRDIINTLNERFCKQRNLIKQYLADNPLDRPELMGKLQESITIKDLKPEHIHIHGKWNKITNFFQPLNKIAIQVINDILIEIDEMFDQLLKSDIDYENTHFSQIIEFVIEKIENHNGKPNRDVTFKPQLLIYIVGNVSRYSYSKYKRVITSYEKNHSIKTNLLKYKPQALRLFIDVCESKSQELQATHALCNYLKDLIKEKVERNIYRKIQIEIHERYFSQKSYIMQTILEELANKNDFETYMRYIRRPERFVLEWITEKTNTAVFEKSTAGNMSLYDKWTNDDTNYLIDFIKDTVDGSTQECIEQQDLDIEKWRSVFVDRISKQNLLLTSNTFEHLKSFNIKSFVEFRDHIKKELSEIEPKIIAEFKGLEPSSIKWPIPTPYQCIFDEVWGCKEKCPFCSEPCQKSQSKHGSKIDHHMCIQHRCTAVNGIHWRKSEKLSIESCNFDVQSKTTLICGNWCKCPNLDTCSERHPYKNYKKYCPDWDIEPCTDTSRSEYWNWFTATHKSELADYYGCKMPDIPNTWYNITKEKAIESLKEVYLTI